MTSRWHILRWLTHATTLFSSIICFSTGYALDSRAYLQVSHEHTNSLASAIDANGKLHRGKDYHSQTLPWINDRINNVAPTYPFSERLHRHQGYGIIRLTLDLKTGTVMQASVVKSTGFSTLNDCALSALRQWRWRPARWKEINLPVQFQLSDPSAPLPKDAAVLPPSRR